jgi:hypothetical protein
MMFRDDLGKDEGWSETTPNIGVQGVSWSAISGGSIVLEAKQGTQTRSRE